MFGRKDRPVVVSVSQPTRTEYVTRNIHEHRAPTDESVRLLREMEQAARDSVEQSFNVGGNGFECVVTVNREFASNDIIARAVFSLNGKRMTAEGRVRGFEISDPTKLFQTLRDNVAQVIAGEVIEHSFSMLLKQVRRD